jgi:hypothetical protein
MFAEISQLSAFVSLFLRETRSGAGTRGAFYPEGVPTGERFKHYAKRHDPVELTLRSTPGRQ